jgi:hypothetical protein
VTEPNSGRDEELIEWLKEAGRRTADPIPHNSHDDEAWSNSPAHLFHYLEELAGRKLRSQAELLSYLQELSGESPRAHRNRERRRIIREGILLVALTLAWLQYYFWEVHAHIASLPCVQVFGVLPPEKSKKSISSDTLSGGVLVS